MVVKKLAGNVAIVIALMAGFILIFGSVSARAETLVPQIKILEPLNDFIVYDDLVQVEFAFNSSVDPASFQIFFNHDEIVTSFQLNPVKGYGRCTIANLPLGAGIIKLSVNGRRAGSAFDTKTVSVQKRPFNVAGNYQASSHINIDALVKTIYNVFATVIQYVPDAPEIPAYEDLPLIVNGITLQFRMNINQDAKDLTGLMNFQSFILELPEKDDIHYEYSGENALASFTGVINDDNRLLFFPFNFVFFPDVSDTQKEILYVIIDAIADDIFKDVDPAKKEEIVNMVKTAIDQQMDSGSGFSVNMTGIAGNSEVGGVKIEGKMVVQNLILILPGEFTAQSF
jgi:hypothetical protein